MVVRPLLHGRELREKELGILFISGEPGKKEQYNSILQGLLYIICFTHTWKASYFNKTSIENIVRDYVKNSEIMTWLPQTPDLSPIEW